MAAEWRGAARDILLASLCGRTYALSYGDQESVTLWFTDNETYSTQAKTPAFTTEADKFFATTLLPGATSGTR